MNAKFNGAYEGLDDIGNLIHDLRTVEPEDMRIPLMAGRMTYLRKMPEGENYMYDSIKDIIDKATSRQMESRNREVAENLLLSQNGNLTDETIAFVAKISQISSDSVRELANQLKSEGKIPA